MIFSRKASSIVAILAVGLAVALGTGFSTGWKIPSIKNTAASPSIPKKANKQNPTINSSSSTSANNIRNYDVLVFGGTPEGVAAAISSSRQGLKTCLAIERNKLGGVWSNGRLNQMDNTYEIVRTSPTVLYRPTAQGINEEFLNQLGCQKMTNGIYDGVFDSDKVKPVFQTLLKNNKVDYFNFDDFTPTVANRQITGVKFAVGSATEDIRATYFIDASETGELAARSGCPYTLGRSTKVYGKLDRPVALLKSEYGTDEAIMCSTLLFRLGGINWSQIQDIVYKGKVDTCGKLGNAAWGYRAVGYSYNTQPSMPNGVMLKGLNMGRQSDGSVWINGLLVFGVNSTSQTSIQNGVRRARAELPKIVNHLKANIPAFKNAYLIGSAETLYIRESRHFIGEYILKLDDLLQGVQPYDKIAPARYPVHIHPYTQTEAYNNLMKYGSLVDAHLQPKLYGIPLRSLLPMRIDNLLIVGKTISCTPKAAGSARIISIGISEAESAGKVVAASKKLGRSLKDLAYNKQFWTSQ